ncbi:hypothetical protein CRE_16310 [Caenorhabditis remanei]|uniref:Uncharacterized protein n=1 Tax=Caenorhabditis remanei TaxID=31234 RepID=E3N817_CAERE|nr:hypothetical protein CRE_16310 [Caenorhabditis remanei]
MEDFYLTLPSSTETPSFSNTLSVYTTRLPQVLNLEKDKWVVGATDIIYPYSYKNVNKVLKCYIHFKDARQPVYFNFPANQYKTVDQVLSVLNGNPRKRRNVTDAGHAEALVGALTGGSGADKSPGKDSTNSDKVSHDEVLVGALTGGSAPDKSPEKDSEASSDNTSHDEVLVGTLKSGKQGPENTDAQTQDSTSEPKTSSGNSEDTPHDKPLVGALTGGSAPDKSPEKDSEASSDNTSHDEVLVGTLKSGKQGPENTDAQTQDSTSEPKTSSGNSEDTPHDKPLVGALTGGEQGSEDGPERDSDNTSDAKSLVKALKGGQTDSEILAFLLTFILLTIWEKEERDQIVEALKNAETGGVKETEDDKIVLKRILEKHFVELEKLHGVDSSLQEALRKMADNQTTFLETFQNVNNPNTLNSIVSKMSDDQSAFLKALSEKEDSSAVKKAIDALKSQLINNSKYEYKKLIGAIEEARLDELTSLRNAMKPKNVPFIGNLINFKVENDVLKVEFKDSNVLFIEFDKECAYFLGFHNCIVKNNETASSSIDFFGNISTLYVYCDVVDQTIVGNSKSSLLTVIPCKGKYGEMVQHTFPVPRYLPLMNGTIDSIKVQILSEFGDRIHFNWGSTIITLHFRKIA